MTRAPSIDLLHRGALTAAAAARNPARLRARPLLLVLAAAAALAGCASVPPPNAELEQARTAYVAARSDPQTTRLAAAELQQAGDALRQAEGAWRDADASARIDHLAYLARQRTAIAQTLGQQRAAQAAVTLAEGDRDKIRLAARTSEVDTAQRSAQDAQRQSAQSQGQADAAQRDAAASQQQTAAAQARSAQLEAQLKALDGKQTDRGLVITIGDVLFDTNQSALKSGSLRNMDKLVAFLQQYPQRTALIEGFTDSVGSESLNQALSARRADAVRQALVSQGVSAARISTQGHGEAHPVAANDNDAGRQLNRRVEIVLSDEGGRIAPR